MSREPGPLGQALTEWAAAHPEPEWDSQDSNAYQDRAELTDEGPEPGATGIHVDPESGWSQGEPYVDAAHGTMFWDTAKGTEASGAIDWQRVYGDGWEEQERIWDGRGLDVNDARAKAEPEREAGG